jgi:MYXO-CTERM domain-containing protein
MLRVVDVLRAARDVDGYARTGVVERFLTRRELAGFSSPLTSDAIVLDLHSRPSFLQPGIEAGAGLLLLGAAALRRRRAPAGAETGVRTESAAGVGETSAAAGEAEMPAVLERRLPAVMLLNLEPSAPLSDIEYAPPLGSPQEVAAQIVDVLGPLTDEGAGKYSIAGTGWQLGFDIGRGDPVWTVAVDVRGTDLALVALDKLARETRWRVYVPRLGTFR